MLCLNEAKAVCSSALSGVFHTVYMVLVRWHCSRCMENFHDLTFIKKYYSPSDYGPIAITSVVMKYFEKIVLQHLLDLTKGMLDSF